VLLDIVILGVLWTMVAMSDGGFLRWARGTPRRMVPELSGRLTVTLFAFFMIPAVAFAVWSVFATDPVGSRVPRPAAA
jgi:hypothetical protein